MKKPYLISFFLLFAIIAYGQTDLKKIVPPNPNVASLFKSVITPVTEYSGLPNVSVPLYTMTEGGISMPISISYATGGIQVSEESGIVGLGWALNIGGVITRSVVGEDDFDLSYGYLAHNRLTPDIPNYGQDPNLVNWNPDSEAFINSLPSSGQDNCEFYANGNPYVYAPPPLPGGLDFDFQPDIFYFNFGGYSGSFVLEKDGTPFLMSKKGIEIILIPGGTDGLANPSFNIVTEDGTKYEFFERANTTYPNGALNTSYISSWYLKTITDIYGNTAELQYDINEEIKPFRSFTQSYMATVGQSTAPTSGYEEYAGPEALIDNPYLTSIRIKKANSQETQRIQMNYSELGDRLDLNARYLESIEIFNALNQRINTYDFSYCYFGNIKSYDYNNISIANGDFGQTIGALDPGYPDLNLRLRLDAITENNINTHAFEYHIENTIPNKTSFNQDYWGFYNAAGNTESFIPEINSSNEEISSFNQLKRANRIPAERYAKLFSLKKIMYPTGGATEFEYELNTFEQTEDLTYQLAPTIAVQRSASAVSLFEGENLVTETIRPNQNTTLKIFYNVTFAGWNTEQYPDAGIPPPEPSWVDDFYVALKTIDGQILHKFNINSANGNQEWYIALQNRAEGEIYDYDSRVIKDSDYHEWSYDFNEPYFRLTEDEYVLEAYFNSQGGKYYGQAHILAEWEDVEVDKENRYSVGAGLRVRTITDIDSNGEAIARRKYNYHYEGQDENLNPVTKSYGKIKTIPDFAINRQSVLDLRSKSSEYGTQSGAGFQSVVLGSASSQNSFSKDAGSYVGYDQVEITQMGEEGDNGKTIKYFHNPEDLFRVHAPIEYVDDYYKNPPIRLPHHGLLKKEQHFKREGQTYTLVGETENFYNVNNIDSNDFTLLELYKNDDQLISASKELPITFYGVKGASNRNCSFMKFQLYPHFSNLIQQTGTTQTVWDENGSNPIVTVQEFKYENPVHLQRTESKLTNSKGEEVLTKTYYADDITDISSLGTPNLTADEKGLIDRFKKNYTGDNPLHRVAEPIQTETTVNGAKTVQRTYYKDWDGDENVDSYRVWPEKVQTLKGAYHAVDNPMENRLNYHQYDDRGNPLEVSKENGTKIAYIWAYDGKYPVAKIEHSGYTNAANAVQAALPAGHADLDSFLNSLAGIENDPTKKTTWDNFNMNLRNALDDQMVTTYTYTPLVGVTSVTDPRGYTMYYQYDAYNRLQEVRDADDHLVTDYEYHYKGQTNN